MADFGVADVDGGGAGGDLEAVAAFAAAASGLAPGDGDFEALATKWNTADGAIGKTVWAELPLPLGSEAVVRPLR